jgi:predicted permease
MWLQDLGYALRATRRNPGFALAAIVTLSLGIGANTLVFSAVDGIVLNPFDFPQPDRLVGVGTAFPRAGVSLSFVEHMSPAEYQDIARESRTLTHVVAWDMGNRQIATDEVAENLFTGFWWGNAFPTLGVEPHMGRGFSDEEIANGERVLVVSHSVWQTTFGEDPALVGKTLAVNGNPYTVVGVMPPGTSLYGMDLWMPMAVGPEVFPRERRQFQILARVAEGSSLAEVNAELEGLARRTEQEYGREHEEYVGWSMEAQTWNAINTGLLSGIAWIVTLAAAFLLLMVCTNVASLVLARLSGRQQELAVRRALGAGGGRLSSLLLTESMLLALLGGLAGIALANAGVDALSRILATLALPIPGGVEVNARVLTYNVGVSLAAGLLLGLLPAWSAGRTGVQTALRGDTPSATASRGRLRTQRVFVGVQVALAVVLLTAGGLLVRSGLSIQRMDLGYQPENLLTMRLTLPWEEYQGEAIAGFFQSLDEEIESIPGVVSASATTQLPPRVFSWVAWGMPGATDGADAQLPGSYLTQSLEDYFDTMAMTLRQGRLFDSSDEFGGPVVAVVNEVFADRYFPGGEPIGQTIRLGGMGGEGPDMRIVGVVSASRNRGPERPAQPEVFVSAVQGSGTNNQLFLAIRTDGDPRAVLPAIRERVRLLDSDQPVYAIATMEETMARSMAARSAATRALVIFAVFALILAAVGIYGVVAYSVGARTREIGLRVALGADGGSVRSLMIRQALLPVAAGLALGVAGAVGASQVLRVFLVGIGPQDPATFGGVSGLLLVVALSAAWLPARRAAGLDPVEALRGE